MQVESHLLVMKNTLLIFLLLLVGTANAKNYQWRQLAHFPPIARHQQAAFAIGNQIFYGMGHYNSAGNVCFDDLWAYDPASNSWTQKADYPGDPLDSTADFVIDNKAYVGTGVSFTNVKEFYMYDPQINVWTQKADFLGTARRAAIGFAIGDYGYIGGGSGGNDFYRYDPQNDQWQQVATLPGSILYQGIAFVIDSNAYVGCGNTITFYKYNPLPVDTWDTIASMPGTPTWRAAGTAWTIDGKGYAGMGVAMPGTWNRGDFWEYDPATDTWDSIGKFGGQKRRFMEAVVIGDKAYMGMGTDGTNLKDFWVWLDVPLDTSQTSVSETNPEIAVTIFPNPTRHL